MESLFIQLLDEVFNLNLKQMTLVTGFVVQGHT